MEKHSIYEKENGFESQYQEFSIFIFSITYLLKVYYWEYRHT